MAKTTDKSKLSFEEAMASLENVVMQLEKGESTLEDSMRLFSEGMELSRICNEKINSIEHKVTQLVRDSQGNIHEVEFEE